ncbi:Uncharacterised protein [Escherichia coli]|uniref:Uncharacterized protein n=1 Tax=Escherichia coli TaxID=562 RepID=A0A376MKQ2_ECOLX|nr:Uncharacterised protein [Escherichia coli]
MMSGLTSTITTAGNRLVHYTRTHMQSRWSKVAIFTTRWAAGWQNGYGGVNGNLTGWMSLVTETGSGPGTAGTATG